MLHSPKLTVWCRITRSGINGLCFFRDVTSGIYTVKTEWYRPWYIFFIPALQRHSHLTRWFQHDGASHMLPRFQWLNFAHCFRAASLSGLVLWLGWHIYWMWSSQYFSLKVLGSLEFSDPTQQCSRKRRPTFEIKSPLFLLLCCRNRRSAALWFDCMSASRMMMHI